MAALRQLLVEWGFQFDERAVDNANRKVNSLASSAKALAAIFAGSAFVARVKAFTQEMVGLGTQLADTSARLNVSTESLQRLDIAAQIAGASFQDVVSGLQAVAKNADAIRYGNATMARDFRRLGVSVRDASGNLKPADVLFRELGLGLTRIKNPAERAVIAMRVLGGAGLKLLPMFTNGAEALDEMLGRLDRLGGGLSDEAIGALTKTAELTTEYNYALRSLKSTIATSVMPSINAFLAYLTRGYAAIVKLEKTTSLTKTAFVVLGAAAVQSAVAARAAWLPALVSFAKAALPVAALVLLVEDLITTLEGGESVFKSVFDGLFGEGSTADFVKEIHDAWKYFVTDVFKSGDNAQTAGDKWRVFFLRLGGGIEQVGKDFNEFFGILFDKTNKWLDVNINEPIQRLSDEIRNWFATLPEDFKRLGSDILRGLLDGLSFAAGEVKDFFVNLGKESLRAAKSAFSFFGGGSSKSAAGSVAKSDLVQGIAEGAQDFAPTPRKTFTSETFAPQIPKTPRGAAAMPVAPVTMDQRNTITVNVQATGDVRRDVREGIRLGLSDEREALIAAVESAIEVG